MTTLTLWRACSDLKDMTELRDDDMVEFPRRRHVFTDTDAGLSELERKLYDNGIIHFARQEFDRRIYHVSVKRLAAVLEAGQ